MSNATNAADTAVTLLDCTGTVAVGDFLRVIWEAGQAPVRGIVRKVGFVGDELTSRMWVEIRGGFTNPDGTPELVEFERGSVLSWVVDGLDVHLVGVGW